MPIGTPFFGDIETSLEALTDTQWITPPADTQVLAYSIALSKWINTDFNLNLLSNVNATGAADGDVLSYDNGSGLWIATTPPIGPTGPAGADGADGADGQGVPVGGTAGQILSKIDATDFNTQWINASSGGGTPGGISGQLQWNNGGSFDGLPLTWDTTNTQLVWKSEGTTNSNSGSFLRVRDSADTKDTAWIWFGDTGWALMGEASDFYSIAIPGINPALFMSSACIAFDASEYAFINSTFYFGTSAAGGGIRLTPNQVGFFSAPTNYIEFRSPLLSSATTYYLPATDGTNGDTLTTDGSGNLSWTTIIPDDSAASSGDVLTTDGAGSLSWSTPDDAWEQVIFIEEANNGTITIDRLSVPLTINSIETRADAGSCDATLSINGTAITGINGVSVGASFATATATGGNNGVADDVLTLTISNAVAAEGVFIKIRGTI